VTNILVFVILSKTKGLQVASRIFRELPPVGRQGARQLNEQILHCAVLHSDRLRWSFSEGAM